jgi:hypothetical protein
MFSIADFLLTESVMKKLFQIFIVIIGLSALAVSAERAPTNEYPFPQSSGCYVPKKDLDSYELPDGDKPLIKRTLGVNDWVFRPYLCGTTLKQFPGEMFCLWKDNGQVFFVPEKLWDGSSALQKVHCPPQGCVPVPPGWEPEKGQNVCPEELTPVDAEPEKPNIKKK